MTGLDEIFGALADPTRRAIVARLARSETTVGELAAPFAISLPAISRHLKVLRSANLIERTRNGQTVVCRMNPAALKRGADWFDFHREFWETSLDRLTAVVEHRSEEKAGRHGRKSRQKLRRIK